MGALYLTALKDISRELAMQAIDLKLLDPKIFFEVKKAINFSKLDLLGELINAKHVDELELAKKVAKKIGFQLAKEYSLYEPEMDFPAQYCLRNGLLPIRFEGDDGYSIAICSPLSLNAFKNFQLLTESKVKTNIFFIPYTELKSNLALFEDRVKSISPGSLQDARSGIANDGVKSRGSVNKTQHDSNLLSDSLDQSLSNQLGGDVVNGINEIFERAIENNISDIHIEQYKDVARIRFRKNGVLITPIDLQAFVSANYPAVISRIKIISGLDIAERRLPQDGGANYSSSRLKAEIDLRISIIPTTYGERAVLRVLKKSSLAMNLESLGFSDSQKTIFKTAIDAPQGLVLVTGPTGSGKSTTLYGAINYLNKEDVNILTIEDPVEYSIEGIGQVQVRDEINLTFSTALRSLLRQDPEIILVGEIRDFETADIATKAALTGHLVLSTLHTNSAIGAITRLINMGLPKYLVSNAITCVIAQRLLRVNCKHCLRKYSAHEIDAISKDQNFSRVKVENLQRGAGCEQCNHTGYGSRKAVHEVLSITNDIKSAIDAGETENQIYEIAKSHGYTLMMERGLEYVNEGTTTFEELMRSVPAGVV
jgi:type IV pilus assembly protein PilB